MKKYFFMLLAVCLFIGCGKDKEKADQFSTKQLEGHWQRVDSRLPDGKYSSEFTGILAEIHQCNNQSFFEFTGDEMTFLAKTAAIYGNTITCQGQITTVKYKIEGVSIKIIEEYTNYEMLMYDILKLTDTRMEMRLNKEAVEYLKRNISSYNIQNMSGYSLEDLLLKNVIILQKIY